ncbi:MAG: hypothetical protein U0350_29435 [Caldilineaceae bacterium]
MITINFTGGIRVGVSLYLDDQDDHSLANHLPTNFFLVEDIMTQQNIWGSPLVTLSAPAEITLNATAADAQLALVTPNAKVELQAGSGPASLTQVLAFRVPVCIADHQRLVGFVQELTLGITKSNGVRVLVIADLAGTMKIFEEGFADPTATPITQPLRSERFFSIQGLETAGLGVLGVEKPAPDYEATLIITVQRRNLNEYAMVAIDALDIVAHLG